CREAAGHRRAAACPRDRRPTGRRRSVHTSPSDADSPGAGGARLCKAVAVPYMTAIPRSTAARRATARGSSSASIKGKQAEMSSTGPTERQVLDALRGVRDGERGGDIVDLGMVSGLAVRDGHVAFAIEVEPARAARLEPLR